MPSFYPVQGLYYVYICNTQVRMSTVTTLRIPNDLLKRLIRLTGGKSPRTKTEVLLLGLRLALSKIEGADAKKQ